MKHIFWLLLATLFFSISCDKIPFWGSKSFYTHKIDDNNGVYLLSENFPLHADGKTDDSEAIQAAIDYVQKYNGFGIVFIPSGQYAIHNPVYVWRGIRLIGYGRKRPQFILPENTHGYQSQKQYMVQFMDRKPLLDQEPVDAGNTTFYSGISNIDLKIEKGNPSAVGIRFNAAQLSSLEHMDFKIESGIAAVEQAGSQIFDCKFNGGGFGLTLDGSSSGAQTLIMNCKFSNHDQAGILTCDAGLTVIGCGFENMSHAIVVRENRVEKLYIQDTYCKNVTVSAVLTSKYNSPDNYILMDTFQCANTPNVLLFRDRNTPVSINEQFFQINELYHGLLIDRQVANKYNKSIRTKYGYNVLEDLDDPVEFKVPRLPGSNNWFNVQEYGAIGDAYTDNTIAFNKAITDHKTIYLPMGLYVISEPLVLRKNTKIVGLHPKATQIILLDNTAKFSNPDSLEPMVIAPENGKNMISGIGFNAGLNPGTVQLRWMAGRHSYLNDIWFEWGGQGDTQQDKEFSSSLRIDNNGGGFFKNIWCANLFANTSVMIQNTQTPGQVYLMGTENNHRNIAIQNVENWNMTAIQCEENMGRQQSLMIDVRQDSRVNFNNVFVKREITLKKDNNFSLRLDENSSVVIRGMHNSSWGNVPFDTAVFYTGQQLLISEKDFSYTRVPNH